jgi:hypothetical protein
MDQQSASASDNAELEVAPLDSGGEVEGGASGDEFGELPGRPLRKRFGPVTYLLLGLIVACGAFYGGARYGKSQGTSGSTGGFATLASRFGATTGGTLPGGVSFPGGTTPGKSSTTSSSAPSRSGSGGFSFLGGGVSGTIKLITGKNFYVQESTGTIVKVDTKPGTAITVSSGASVTQLHPGDSVTVFGTNTSGTVSATRVTDSGSSTSPGGKG